MAAAAASSARARSASPHAGLNHHFYNGATYHRGSFGGGANGVENGRRGAYGGRINRSHSPGAMEMTLVRDSAMDPCSASYPAPDHPYPAQDQPIATPSSSTSANQQSYQRQTPSSTRHSRPIGELTMTRGGKTAGEKEKSKDGKDMIRDAIAAGVITVYAPRRKTAVPGDEADYSGMTTTTTIETTTTASTDHLTAPYSDSANSHDQNQIDNQVRGTLIPQMSLTTEEGEETSECQIDDGEEEEEDEGADEDKEVRLDFVDHATILDDQSQADVDRNGGQTNSENELTQDSIDSGGTVIDVAASSRTVKKTADTNKPANLVLPADASCVSADGGGDLALNQARTTETIEEEDRLSPMTPSNAVTGASHQQHHHHHPAPLSASASISTPASPSFFFHYGSPASPSSLHPPPSPIPDIVLPPRSESEMELAADVGDAERSDAADEGRQVGRWVALP